jgi:hypothetical protein
MLKCECSVCGYTVRVTRKWLSLVGPPICLDDRIPLTPEVAARPFTKPFRVDMPLDRRDMHETP